MFYVSEPQTTAPREFHSPLQRQVYQTLETLAIPFERVDTDEAITMNDCVAINARLDMRMVKTLFLCDRRQTAFYLFITKGEKPFRAKDFSAALNISRVSFAPPEKMDELLGTKIGAATVFSALRAQAENVRIVFDQDVLEEEFYGCSDGTTTGYLKLKTDDILHRLLPYVKHIPAVITI